MRATPLALLLLSPLLALGCGEKDGDDTGASDDTGGDNLPDYEEGCILVDGQGGYAWLSDALEVASEGSTIELCEGDFDQGVTVNKSVSIVGPGVDAMVWTAPVNQPAILVEGASSVDISGFTVASTRNGIDVEGSSDVRVHDVRFEGVDVAGVNVTDSTGVVIEACAFIANGGGGVYVDGGSAAVQDNEFAAPLGFAVRATDGAVVDVARNIIADVTYTAAGEDGVSDGFALWATEGATLRTDANTLTNNFVNVLTDSSDIELSGDAITGGLYGLYTAGGTQSVSDVTITDALLVGIRAVSQEDVTFSNVSVVGDPGVVDSAEFNWTNYTGGGVTVATDGTFTATGLSIEGYNNNGLLILGYSDVPTAVIDGLSITNVGRRALTQYSGSLTLTDAEVHDTRLVVDRSELTGQYDSQTAGLTVGLWNVTTIWDGGGIYGSEDMGAINFQGSMQLTNFTLDGNYNYGIWNYQGSVYASSSTFTRGSYYGSVVNQLGELTLENNTFIDNVEPLISEYTNEETGDVSRTEQAPYTRDIVCVEHGSCNVLNNSFTNGARGITVSAGGASLIEGNSWQDYHSYTVSVSQNTDDTVEVVDNTFTNIGAYALRCYDSDMEIDGATVSGVVGAMNTYTSYLNGEVTNSFEYSSTGQAVYGSLCSMVLNDVSIEDAAYHGVILTDSTVEMYEVSVDGGSESGTSSYGAVRLYYSSVAPAVLISGLEVNGNALGPGLQVTSSSSLDAGTVILDSVTVSGAAGAGVSLDYVQEAELSNIIATGNSSHGVVTSSSTLSIDTAVLNGNGGYGAWLNASGDVAMSDVTAQQNASGGVYLTGGAATVVGNSFDSNTGYGMTCDASVTLDACSDNDLSGNSDGEHDGCDDSCGAASSGG
ncbi:MAG: right-handed parallel beta-helix repeat-containing protein [Alphaproteobacteria bacterium]|nr:right-handed parallel beta-helix repeat-containing protein [Alphaproteobacteria bacterium]